MIDHIKPPNNKKNKEGAGGKPLQSK